MPPKRPDDPLEGPKRALRQAMRTRLATVDRHDLARYSAQICEHALTHERVAAAQTAMIYLPVAGEVDLRPLARVLLDRGATVCAPRMDWEKRTMAPAPLRSLESGLEIRRHGVPEPATDETLDLASLDAVFAPGLAFDRVGGRLGRGAGFYDRFLMRLERRRTAIVGACMEIQIVPGVPVGPRDVRVDWVVTETDCRRATNLETDEPGGTT